MSATASSHPAVDAITSTTMVMLQDRPIVSFTKWVADALRVCSETGRGLQIVTPPESRITMPLRTVLTVPPSRWVVRVDGGYYDGLSGAVLRWDGETFTQAAEARTHAPGFTTPPSGPIGAQLTVTFRVRHTPDIVVGGAVEQMCLSLTGQPPAGWGTAEPAAGLWRREELTELFRSRAPRATWLTVVGASLPADPARPGPRATIGTMLLSQADSVVEEAVTLVVGYDRPQDPPVGSLPTLIGVLAAEHRLMSLFAQLSPGRADLATEPLWVGPPAPIGMAVGADMVGSSAPAGVSGQQIGDMRAPVIWYTLGDGWSQEGWQRYQELSQHLRSRLT